MDALFIQLPSYDRKPNKRVQPQLGIAYIASYLLEKGLQVGVIDGEVHGFTIDEIVDQILKARPMAVGITTPAEDRFHAIELAGKIKARSKGIFVFVGGAHFSYSAQDALEHVPYIDVVVIGEGEFTSYELLQAFEQRRTVNAFHDIKGCAFRDESGQVVITPQRGLIVNPDEMPGPAWHLYDMDKYQLTLSVEEKTRAIGIISSRGCPYQCVFCSNSLNRRVRYRDPILFVDEVQLLHERYGFPGLNFQDDSFTANPRHVTHICEEILGRNIKIRWYCSLRVNNVSQELLGLMKEAGCVALGYGIETGSDRLLKLIKKGITTDQVRKAVNITKELGFKHVSLFLMTSLPGQTREDIRMGSEFLSEMHSVLSGTPIRKVFLGTPTLIYPGTETEVIARRNANVFPRGFSWNTYYKTDRARVFNSNPYVPHFENPDFSLEKIKAYAQQLTRQWERKKMPARFFNLVAAVRTPKDLGELIARTWRALPTFLRLN